MKLREGAAIAIAGWILLAPTIDCARRGLERETPLSQWERVDQFQSQKSCEDYRAVVIDAEKSDSKNLFVRRYSYSVCVKDDDPRLNRE
jgi:hypothetical protein